MSNLENELESHFKKREWNVNYSIVFLFVLLNIWFRHFVHYKMIGLFIIFLSALNFIHVFSLLKYLINNKNELNRYKKRFIFLIIGLLSNIGFIAIAIYYYNSNMLL